MCDEDVIILNKIGYLYSYTFLSCWGCNGEINVPYKLFDSASRFNVPSIQRYKKKSR